jgi:hypothetical protein
MLTRSFERHLFLARSFSSSDSDSAFPFNRCRCILKNKDRESVEKGGLACRYD